MTITALLVAALLQAMPAARVSNVGLGVEIIRSNGTVVARIGDTIPVGDQMRTPAGSFLALDTESGVILQLGSSSRLEMKKEINGEVVALFTEGSLKVRNAGKTIRIETKYGRILSLDESGEFDVSYSGDLVEVVANRGGVISLADDPLKVVFKSSSDAAAMRIYEAGSLSSTSPREASQPTIVVYPQVGNPNSTRKLPAPVTPQVPPK